MCQKCVDSQTDTKSGHFACPVENTHDVKREGLKPSRFTINKIKKSNSEYISCAVHADKRAELYCKDENVLVCNTCITEEH